MSDTPDSLAARFCHTCLLILAGIIALNIAVNILRCIWLWLVIGTVVAGLVSAIIAWLRNRANRW